MTNTEKEIQNLIRKQKLTPRTANFLLFYALSLNIHCEMITLYSELLESAGVSRQEVKMLINKRVLPSNKALKEVAERVKKNLYDIFGDKDVFKESFDAWSVFETAPNANEAVQLFAYAFAKKPAETIDSIIKILNEEDKK